MRRRKSIPTRRRRALRWLAVLGVLLAASHLLGVYCLTPGRVLRRAEQEHFCGRTEWLRTLTDLPGREEGSLRLSGGKRAVTLGLYDFSWQRGWYASTIAVLEREQERPFAAYLYSGWSSTDPETRVMSKYFYLFGALESPVVARLEIAFDAGEGGHDQTAVLTGTDWITDETGDRFFLCPLEPEVDLWSWKCSVTAYDADGTDLGTFWATGEPRWE